MARRKRQISRRSFLKGSAAAATFTIVPSHVLGGPGKTPPSDTFGGVLVGCGGRGTGTFGGLGRNVVCLACCDVDRRKAEGKVRWANKKGWKAAKPYQDFRRVMERADIDVVAIATPPHWHPLISIAAMESGKDVVCEKPMSRFIAEGRAVVEAEKRYSRIFQVGTYGRFGASKSKGSRTIHKIMKSGLAKGKGYTHIKRGGLKVAQWSGLVNVKPQPIPEQLDWDMYCGPSPLRPYHPHRTGGTHRGYWDYEGGGLADMGQHHFDPTQWTYAKDDTSPVEVDVHTPPAHPEACAMWGWAELTFDDGTVFVMDSKEWGKPYDRKQPRQPKLSDFTKEQQKIIEAIPDPDPMVDFATGIRQRKKTGGSAEPAHRTATLLHLANIAIRIGRKFRYDPVKEEIIGDEEANRLVNQPMRAPWHL